MTLTISPLRLVLRSLVMQGSALVERIVVHDRSDVLVRVESLQQLQTLLEGHLLPKRSTEEQKPEKKMNE